MKTLAKYVFFPKSFCVFISAILWENLFFYFITIINLATDWRNWLFYMLFSEIHYSLSWAIWKFFDSLPWTISKIRYSFLRPFDEICSFVSSVVNQNSRFLWILLRKFAVPFWTLFLIEIYIFFFFRDQFKITAICFWGLWRNSRCCFHDRLTNFSFFLRDRFTNWFWGIAQNKEKKLWTSRKF